MKLIALSDLVIRIEIDDNKLRLTRLGNWMTACGIDAAIFAREGTMGFGCGWKDNTYISTIPRCTTGIARIVWHIDEINKDEICPDCYPYYMVYHVTKRLTK